MTCELDTRARDDWAGWHRKRKIGRKKVSRSLRPAVVWNLTEAWYFAAQKLGLDFNIFVTVKPNDIDALTPLERIARWEWFREKVAQYARDHGFECVLIWSRETNSYTSDAGEHLHVLTHIPPELTAHFRRTVSRWLTGHGEVDIKRADYVTRWTWRGKARSMIGYITKNSPQAAYRTDREYRKGGPILGKRAGCSRNIDERARLAWDAAIREQQRADALRALYVRAPHPARQWEHFASCS